VKSEKEKAIIDRIVRILSRHRISKKRIDNILELSMELADEHKSAGLALKIADNLYQLYIHERYDIINKVKEINKIKG